MLSQRSLFVVLVLAGACVDRGLPQDEEAGFSPGVTGGKEGLPDSGVVGGTGGERGPGAAGGAGSSSGGEAGQGTGGSGCDDPVLSKRIVRLTFAQLAATLEELLGADAATALRTDLDIEQDLLTFPPQLGPREGSVVTDQVYARGEAVAQWVFDHLMANFAEASGCGTDPGDACAQEFMEGFAERAFRRPLSASEASKLRNLYDEAIGRGAPVEEAASWGAYAALEWPQFLYRTELGDAATEDGPVTSLELASEISYFLGNGPPDRDLMDAALDGALKTPEQLAPHVDRLRQSDAAQTNLERALLAHFRILSVYDARPDPDLYPELDLTLRDSMAQESRLFLHAHAWTEPVESLFTSRRTFLNSELSAIYGVALPGGSTADANGFSEVELPEERAGLLTQAAVLTTESRIVPRSVWVMNTLLCASLPPGDGTTASSTPVPAAGSRAAAEQRMSQQPCAGCHLAIDPYGIALDGFDALGRTRTTDDEGNPISTVVTLPELLGRRTVDGAASMAALLASDDLVSPCLAERFLSYALAGEPVARDQCRVSDVLAERQNGDDPSFGGLARAIALSSALRLRKGAP